MSTSLIDPLKLNKCPVCGREFWVPSAEWGWKVTNKKGHIVYLCRYNCKRAYEKKHGLKKEYFFRAKSEE